MGAVVPVMVTSASSVTYKVCNQTLSQQFRNISVHQENWGAGSVGEKFKGTKYPHTAPTRYQSGTHQPHRPQTHLKWDFAIQQTEMFSLYLDQAKTEGFLSISMAKYLYPKALRGSWGYCTWWPEDTWNQAFQHTTSHGIPIVQGQSCKTFSSNSMSV